VSRRAPGQKVQFDKIESAEDLDEVLRIIKDRLNKLIDGYDGDPSPHGRTHSADQSDPLQTPGAPVDTTYGQTAATGDGPAYAYEDHRHALDLGAAWQDLNLLLAVGAFSRRLPRIPEVQAGANITITHNALGPVIASTGGGSAVDSDQNILATQVFGG